MLVAFAGAPESPRLAQLEREVTAGKPEAIGSFWSEIARQGSPLIEALPGDGDQVLVTFLYRGDSTTTNVLFAAATGGCPQRGAAGSD